MGRCDDESMPFLDMGGGKRLRLGLEACLVSHIVFMVACYFALFPDVRASPTSRVYSTMGKTQIRDSIDRIIFNEN